MLELIIVILYFIAVTAIGIVSRRKQWGLDDFFVSGRRQSSLFVSGSLVATIIGGSATIGMAGLGFSRGLTGSWWILSGSLGLIVLGLFLVRKVSKFRVYTLPELINKQYGSRVALASSLLIIIAWLGVISGQIIAAGKILSVLGTGSPALWMTIFTLIFVFYVILGGQDAVIRTDLLQAVLIYSGIFTALGITLWKVGGIGGLQNAVSPGHFSFPFSPGFGMVELLSYLLLIGSTYVVGPDIYSRLFCARDENSARKSVFWAAGLLVPIALAITLIGIGALALFPSISPEQAFPAIIKNVFPPLAGGLVLAALVSAVMSSADTTLFSAGTILTVDILAKIKPSLGGKKLVAYTRVSLVLLGLASLGLALLLKGIISSLMFAYTIYTCGVILPVAFGLFKDKLKITPLAALTAVVGGGITGLTSKLGNIPYLDIGAFFLSGFLLLMVSLVENRLKAKKLVLKTADYEEN